MRTYFAAAFAAAALIAPVAAFAQDASTDTTTTATTASGLPSATFRGFRVEGNVGGDRFQSQGTHNDKFGYGATIGFDGQIGERIVVGPEASFWRPGNGSENCTAGVNGGAVCHKAFEEYGVAIRAGYLVTPSLLVFGKGGYVSNEQRKSFVPAAGSGEAGYYNHGRTDGYQVGGGVEYSLTSLHTPLPVYVNAQYVYSNYQDHTSRQRVMAGVGVRFK